MRNGLLTVSEAARLARVDPETVRNWCRTGRLKASKIGGSWRIEVTDWDRFSGKVTTDKGETR